MRVHISIDKAISRGHLMVNVPVFIVMIGCPILAFYLYSIDIIPNWIAISSIFFGFVIAWLVWSYMITKWRIWAFENVRNVHELKKRAIEEKLIWRDDHFFEKTEIRSSSDKQKLERLQRKFEKKDVYKDDRSIPKRTKIFYSRFDIFFRLILGLILIIFGFITISSKSISSVFGYIILVCGGYSVYEGFKRSMKKGPQICIDNEGVFIDNYEFIQWSSISGEDVIAEGSGKSLKSYLVFNFRGERIKISIEGMNTTHRKLDKLLKIYRLRYKNNI